VKNLAVRGPAGSSVTAMQPQHSRCERMANAPFRAVFLDECAARDGAHDFGVKVQPASRGALDEPMLSSAGQNPSMSARKRFSAPSAGSVGATSNPLARS
jgi:hypothetical protein